MMSLDDRLAKPTEIAQQYAAEVDRDGRFPEETVAALADASLFGLTVEEAAGGLGHGPSEFLTTTRRIASTSVIGPPKRKLRHPSKPFNHQ